MKHVDDDILLKFVLEILDEPDESMVRNHLSNCADCQQKRTDLRREVAALGAIEFLPVRVAEPRMPVSPRRRLTLLKAAAILVAGFLGGYITAELSNPGRPVVVQQQLQPTPVHAPATQYVSCEQVDIRY